jgi:hypothetical protein
MPDDRACLVLSLLERCGRITLRIRQEVGSIGSPALMMMILSHVCEDLQVRRV